MLEVLPEPVLVGRERELEELQRYLALAKEGKGKTVFVSAEAGLGKTRLMREFLNSLKQEKDIVMLSGWCLFNAGVPYFPFIEAFSSYYSSQGEKSDKEELEINSWLKGPTKTEVPSKLDYLSPQALKDQTFAAIAKTIHSIATKNPVILIIEDIHWADSASLALIHYIARVINDSERVMVLATFRSEELTSGAEGYPHQLVETLAMMRREDLFKQVNLPSLNTRCVAEMAESMLGGSLHQSLAKKLAAESEGNPLFVVESLRMLNERNNLFKENNEWRLTTDELEIPSKFKDIMLQRLACLNNAQRKLLEAASVIGEEFDAGLLGAVVQEDSLEVLETLNVIAHSTSIVRADENRYRFDHARSREILYEELASPLKRGYHSRIANILESSKSDSLSFSDLAHHYSKAGNRDKAVKYALAAAKNEMAKFSNEQAIKHFQYTLQNIQDDRSVVKNAALEGLGDAYFANYMYKEAIKTFDELASRENGLVKLRAIRKAMDAAYMMIDQPDLLLKYAERAEKLGIDDRLELARIIDNRAKAFFWAGRGVIDQDLADYDAALQVFEEENSLADVAEALMRAGPVRALYFDNLREKGLSEVLRSVAIFKEIGDARKEMEATMWTGYTLMQSLLFPEAQDAYARVFSVGERLGVFTVLAQSSINISVIDEIEGRIADALPKALKALEYSLKTDLPTFPSSSCALVARQFSLLGDLKQADKYFDELKKLQEPQDLNSQIYNIVILTAKGVYFAVKAQWEESEKAFKKRIEEIEYGGSFAGLATEVLGRQEYAWALERQGKFDEAKVQRESSCRKREQIEERFKHASIYLSVMMTRKVEAGKEFEIRLDLVNVGRRPGELLRVEGLIPPNSKAIQVPPVCQILGNTLEINKKEIEPFKVETIKLRLLFEAKGIYKLEPTVIYIDDLGETKQCAAEPIAVRCGMRVIKGSLIESDVLPSNFVKSEVSKLALGYLVNAFKEDFQNRKMPFEDSGWRTMMEIVRNAHISMHSMYGRGGRTGKAKLELERLGIVESKLFKGERGRGGRVLKLRICNEKKERESKD